MDSTHMRLALRTKLIEACNEIEVLRTEHDMLMAENHDLRKQVHDYKHMHSTLSASAREWMYLAEKLSADNEELRCSPTHMEK